MTATKSPVVDGENSQGILTGVRWVSGFPVA